MRAIMCGLLVVFLASDRAGETPEPPISDTRLRVSTLVREDVFAGWQSDDMERFARAERNLDVLLEQRPNARAETLVWKGGTKLYRAVLAHEAGETEQFERYFQEARDLFAEARELAPKRAVVAAVVGGSYAVFADRLPEQYRAAAWSESYENYRILWKQQAGVIDRMPLHIGGELLAGLAQSAQRTGRTEELDEYLDKILEVLPDTQYAHIAMEWKENPMAAATGNITCNYCHDAGRLEAYLARLDGK